jgi:nitroreductase
VVAGRRDVRRFDPDRTLPEATLRQILTLAILAPSGYNLQPWRFLIVRSNKNLQKLRRCAFGQPQLADAAVAIIVLAYQNPHLTHLDALIAMRRAEVGMTDSDTGEFRARASRTLDKLADRRTWALRWTLLATGTLLLAAQSMGVSSLLVDNFDEEATRAGFGIPDDHSIGGFVALGFAIEEDPFAGRFGLDEVCYEEHFGQPWAPGEP